MAMVMEIACTTVSVSAAVLKALRQTPINRTQSNLLADQWDFAYKLITNAKNMEGSSTLTGECLEDLEKLGTEIIAFSSRYKVEPNFLTKYWNSSADHEKIKNFSVALKVLQDNVNSSMNVDRGTSQTPTKTSLDKPNTPLEFDQCYCVDVNYEHEVQKMQLAGMPLHEVLAVSTIDQQPTALFELLTSIPVEEAQKMQQQQIIFLKSDEFISINKARVKRGGEFAGVLHVSRCTYTYVCMHYLVSKQHDRAHVYITVCGCVHHQGMSE